jgi:hypothetical protein
MYLCEVMFTLIRFSSYKDSEKLHNKVLPLILPIFGNFNAAFKMSSSAVRKISFPEGQVSEEDEQGAVDVHDAVLTELLLEVDHTQDQS